MNTIKILIIPFIFIFLGAEYKTVLVNRYECDIIDIIDGDTIKVEIKVPEFNVKITNQTIRAVNYDAAEASFRRTSVKITVEEVKIGKLAKEYLQSLCKTHKLYIIPKGHDIYGRRLAILLLSKDGKTFLDVAELMKDNEYIR